MSRVRFGEVRLSSGLTRDIAHEIIPPRRLARVERPSVVIGWRKSLSDPDSPGDVRQPPRQVDDRARPRRRRSDARRLVGTIGLNGDGDLGMLDPGCERHCQLRPRSSRGSKENKDTSSGQGKNEAYLRAEMTSVAMEMSLTTATSTEVTDALGQRTYRFSQPCNVWRPVQSMAGG